MKPVELNPRLTFDTFVAGAANRFALAAARRVAERPGTMYTPLFIYGAAGLGKTHLAIAIGNEVREVFPELPVSYRTLDRFIGELVTADGAGDRESLHQRLDEIRLLILDDLQILAGRPQFPEELLWAWDIIAANGGQIVLTSDRPLQEIDDLDDRLISRLSGGLTVDLGVPDYETRLAIIRRKSEKRGQTLVSGVAETLARIAFSNVRELEGALNRLIAVQELEDRTIVADEVAKLLGRLGNPTQFDEFGSFLAEITDTLDGVVAAPTEGGGEGAAGSTPAQTGGVEPALDVANTGIEQSTPGSSAVRAAADPLAEVIATAVGGPAAEVVIERERLDPWFLDQEKVVWNWPYIGDCIVQDWD
jgi:hypothetical protein